MNQAPRLCLPREARRDFSRPRGLVYHGDITNILAGAPKLVCVGDVVSSYCSNSGVDNLVLVVDGKTRRTREAPRLLVEDAVVVKVSNPPGGLTPEAIDVVHRCVSSTGRCIIIVEGEEDMMALPAIASAPEGSIVTYGVPGVGAAIIRVTGYTKLEASNRLLELKPCPQGFKPVSRGGPRGEESERNSGEDRLRRRDLG